MKKWLLSIVMVAALAAPAMAYVQSGHLVDDPSASGKTVTQSGIHVQRWMDGSNGPIGGPTISPNLDPTVEPVTRPIPEPGTMVLASLGLLALGVSRARRRGH